MYLDNLINAVLWMFMYQFNYFINYSTTFIEEICVWSNMAIEEFFKCFVLLHPGKELFFIYIGSKPRHCSLLKKTKQVVKK